jgi:hypothetical protein
VPSGHPSASRQRSGWQQLRLLHGQSEASDPVLAIVALESSVGPGQRDQRIEIPAVCCSKTFEVLIPGFASDLEVYTAPGKRRSAKVLDKSVCAEPGVPTVPIWERVDANELVVEIDGQAISALPPEVDAILEVTAQLVDCLSDLLPRETNVLVGQPILTRPRPDAAEHFSMNAHQTGVSEELPANDPAAPCPEQRLDDIRFFGAIQRPAGTDLESQASRFVLVDRSLTVGCVPARHLSPRSCSNSLR